MGRKRTYLAREGAQRAGGKGRGFSAEQEGIDLPATLRSWQRAGDERLWKFIVSPEHAERLDLKAHALALVSHMERDLGTRLEWVAIDHYNTDTSTCSSAVGTPKGGADFGSRPSSVTSPRVPPRPVDVGEVEPFDGLTARLHDLAFRSVAEHLGR